LDSGLTTTPHHFCFHNSSISNICKMEADCEDQCSCKPHATDALVDLMKLLTALSTQYSTLDCSIQEQLKDNEAESLKKMKILGLNLMICVI